MEHIISALVENHFGVLVRVAGLFSARGFNIDSLAVGETHDPNISRMTIVVHGDDRIIDQIMKQLEKLIDVIKVEDISKEAMIERELVLIKVSSPASTRAEIMQIVNTFRAKVVDVNSKTLTVEVTGNASKVDAILELLRPFGILEVVRTGTVALSRESILSVGKSQKSSSVETAVATNGASRKKTAKKTKVRK